MQENPTFISENKLPSVEKAPKKEKATAFTLSLVALILVVIFGGTMTVLNFITKNSIAATTTKIQTVDEKISRYQKQKEIIIASFMKDADVVKSINIKQLVADFRQAAEDAGVQFQGFSVKDNMISTNLIATSVNNRDAVSAIIEMMKKYAQNNQQKAFALEPILSISGTPKARMTPVTFKVVPVKNTETDTSNSSN